MKNVITTIVLVSLLAFPLSTSAQTLSERLTEIQEAAMSISTQLESNSTETVQCTVNEDLKEENERLKQRIKELENVDTSQEDKLRNLEDEIVSRTKEAFGQSVITSSGNYSTDYWEMPFYGLNDEEVEELGQLYEAYTDRTDVESNTDLNPSYLKEGRNSYAAKKFVEELNEFINQRSYFK